jgi:ubiquitin
MRMAIQRYRENRWIKGHQEDTVPFELLPLEAQLNVEADQLATAAILGTLKKDTVLQVIKNPYCYAYLLQDGMIITRNEKEILQTKWRGALMRKYLKTRHKHKEPEMKDINWDSFRLARDRMTCNEETYSTKQLTGWLPSGTRKEMYGDQVTACHRCGGIETNDHIVQCPEKGKEHKQSLADFKKLLANLKTTVTVSDAMCHGLEKWMTLGSQSVHQAPRDEWCDSAMKKQDKIGWDIAMRGLLTKEWSSKQESANDGITRGREGEEHGDRWSASVSLWLIQESRRFWTTRNEERQAATSPEVTDKPMALSEAEAGVRLLYGRVLEISEQDRGILAIPLERRLQLPLRSMQEWVKSTKEAINIMAKRHAKREAQGQPEIRQALTAIVTDEQRAINAERQRQKQDRVKPPSAPSTRTTTAVEVATERLARPKRDHIAALMGGARRVFRWARKEKEAEEEKTEAEAESAAEATKKKNKNKKTKRTKEREEKQDEVQRRPYLLEMLDRIKNGRMPKFRTETEDSEQPLNNDATLLSEPTHQHHSDESTEPHMNSTRSSTSETTHHCIA